MVTQITHPPFCRDCRWLEQQDHQTKMFLPNCLRPDRKILNMVDGKPMLTETVTALADRVCKHPGACGTAAVYFELNL